MRFRMRRTARNGKRVSATSSKQPCKPKFADIAPIFPLRFETSTFVSIWKVIPLPKKFSKDLKTNSPLSGNWQQGDVLVARYQTRPPFFFVCQYAAARKIIAYAIIIHAALNAPIEIDAYGRSAMLCAAGMMYSRRR